MSWQQQQIIIFYIHQSSSRFCSGDGLSSLQFSINGTTGVIAALLPYLFISNVYGTGIIISE
jgi:hypothetical protein